MKLKTLAIAVLTAFTTVPALAGGYLTNTNQSISFLRNPARDAYISIDGVYSNPAGVAFMDKGFHFGFNWQMAFQTRTITTQNEILAYGAKNNNMGTKTYEGKATAPFIPSFQAAYNTDKWSFQFNFAVTGGGGKCTFDNGIGSFETAVGGVGYELNKAAEQLQAAGISVPGVTGYDADSYMQGKQFYFGFTLGAAYKFNEHLSAYIGARAIYGTASYKASVENIRVLSEGNHSYTLPEYINAVSSGIQTTTEYAISQYTAGAMAAGMTAEQAQAYAMQQPTVQKLIATGQSMTEKAQALSAYYNGVNLQCDQTGFGVAPILGIDYKIKNFNFAAKYEFQTNISMKNKSTVMEASQIAAVNQFRDGTKIREDMPALLTLGAKWDIIPTVRLSAGYHHYFDKQSKKTYCYTDESGAVVTSDLKNKLLSGDTNEYLGGIEWDPAKKLTVSGGFQITRYGNTDEYMSDMSYNVNSWTFGLGLKYQFNKHVSAQAAYFQTNYGHYKTAEVMDDKGHAVSNDFTRTNNVVGVGVELDF